MKLSSDSVTASDSRVTSPAPAHPIQAGEGTAASEEQMPTGHLTGLTSQRVALRGRRAAVLPRARIPGGGNASVHGGSDLSEWPQSSDATFHTRQITAPGPGIELPYARAVAATYAQRSEAVAAEVKAQLRARLDDLPFAVPSQEQSALQARYLEWADARVQERITAYGPDAGYQVVGDMKTAGAKAALPIAYECLRAFIIGSIRSPVGLATGAFYAGTRSPDAEELSTALLAGAAAGLASYTSETLLLPAMDRRARVANLPRFGAIDPKMLVPDPPPVLLKITAKGKCFKRTGESGAPSFAELNAQAYERRLDITHRQSRLEDKSPDTLLLKPTINAGFNAARRMGSHPSLLSPAGQFGLSALAIGGAGIVQKALLETGKAVATTGQMGVPDLLGGQQRLNLFSLAFPDKTRRPAQWSDALHFPPRYLLETGKEALALARQGFTSVNAITTTMRDVLARHMLCNVLASFGSLGAGRVITRPLHGGRHIRVAGELVNSRAIVAQQAVQTLFNDTFWNALKARNGANTSQATRLDNERATIAAGYQRTIAQTLDAVVELIDQVMVALSAADVIAPAMDESVRSAPGQRGEKLRTALEQLRTEIGGNSISIVTIDAVRTELHDGWREASSGVSRNAITRALNSQLETLKRALHESDELRQWESGRV